MPVASAIRLSRPRLLVLLAAAPLAVGTATSQASPGRQNADQLRTPQPLAAEPAGESEASAGEPAGGEETIYELANTDEGGELEGTPSEGEAKEG